MELFSTYAQYYSDKQIALIADETRYMASCIGNNFDIIWFLENDFLEFDSRHRFRIVNEDDTDVDLTFTEAITKMTVDSINIYVWEDIYEQARHGNGRSRFTLAHELGHALLHAPTAEDVTVISARLIDSSFERRSYNQAYNAEIQCHKFAAELLAPVNLLKGMRIREIMEEFGVSRTVAEIQQRKARFLNK